MMKSKSLIVGTVCLVTAACAVAVVAQEKSNEGSSTAAAVSSIDGSRVADRSALKKRDGVSCTGTEDVELDGVWIESDSDAVQLLGACDIVIKNSVIEAKGHGLVVRGSGEIELHSSEVTAGGTAVIISGPGDVELRESDLIGKGGNVFEIKGSGDVEASKCRLVGAERRTGTGRFKDKGDNERIANVE